MWKARDNASQRTKNRLREHPNMIAKHGPERVFALSGAKGMLLECPDSGWFGWLPCSEIEDVSDV